MIVAAVFLIGERIGQFIGEYRNFDDQMITTVVVYENTYQKYQINQKI